MKKLNLQCFIERHPDWETLLGEPPYSVKISRETMFGRRLVMFKYSQFDSDFMNPLVRECRGIILDEDTFDVVSYAFDKFGNYGEPYCPEIDWKTARVGEKLDGCVRADTKIKTTVGDIDIKTICDNPSKFKVLTYNHQTNSIEANLVEAVSVKDDNADWYEIELEDSTKLTVTGNHQIWCENLGCYRRVDELDGSEILVVK